MQVFQRTQTISQTSILPITKLLFFDTRCAWLWLLVRLYVGYQWLSAGLAKVAGYSLAPGTFGQHLQGGSWLIGGHGQKALQGFFIHSLSLADGPNPAIQSWYAAFLQHLALPGIGVFSYLIPFGELFVGLGLILGLFTGFAAFFGALMNMNYLLAGSISINPILFLLEIFLILAWRICGFYGVDRFLLSRLRNTQNCFSTSVTQVTDDEVLIAREQARGVPAKKGAMIIVTFLHLPLLSPLPSLGDQYVPPSLIISAQKSSSIRLLHPAEQGVPYSVRLRPSP